MNWGKVLSKFGKGFVMGGIGSIVPQIPVIVSGSGGVDVKSGSIMSLLVAFCNAFTNWYKHRE